MEGYVWKVNYTVTMNYGSAMRDEEKTEMFFTQTRNIQDIENHIIAQSQVKCVKIKHAEYVGVAEQIG